MAIAAVFENKGCSSSGNDTWMNGSDTLAIPKATPMVEDAEQMANCETNGVYGTESSQSSDSTLTQGSAEIDGDQNSSDDERDRSTVVAPQLQAFIDQHRRDGQWSVWTAEVLHAYHEEEADVEVHEETEGEMDEETEENHDQNP